MGVPSVRGTIPTIASGTADSVAGLVSVHARVRGTNGVWFVRVEGGSCWLPQTSASDGEPLLALAEEEGVLSSLRGAHPPPPIAGLHYGLFVYRVEDKPIRVWREASCSASQSGSLPVGTVISCHLRKVVGDGSLFARLEDGSGWIRERDGSDGGRLRAAGLEYVRTWHRVTNNGAPLSLRTRPDHASAYRSAREVDGIVTSYARVVGTTGDIYVRVEGRGGWLFETREEQQTLLRLPTPTESSQSITCGPSNPMSPSSPTGREGQRISLADARSLAQRMGWREISINETSRVVSFFKYDVRVNVYYTTGTVGTCLDHPTQGKTQMFRREVTIPELASILDNPRVHTGKGYKRQRDIPVVQSGSSSMSGRGELQPDDEESALVGEIARLTEAAKDLMAARRGLAMQLDMVRARKRLEEEQRKRREKQETARKVQQELDRILKREREEEEQRRVRARRDLDNARALPASGAWRLGSAAANDELESALDNESAADIAICNGGYFVIYDDGRTAWYNVPKGLDNKVRGRQSWPPAPVHVALGPDDQYFILFADGDWSTNGPDDLCDYLRHNDDISRVFLGEKGVWLIIHGDGMQMWSAGLPTGLHNQLNSRSPKLPKPVNASVGPNQTWFVAYANGTWRSSPLPDHADEAVTDAQNEGCTIKRILLGGNDTYYVAYE